jgi:UDPglucose 6-dehydrogenase
VPISTGEKMSALLASRRPENFAAVVSNPEFLRESRAVEDFMAPQQGVIIGSEPGDEAHAELVAGLYGSLGVPVAHCNRRTAETVKYASNTFLATKVSFMNEIAELCNAYEIDVTAVSPMLGMDPRIRDAYLGAGLGWGGSCLPKDLAALRTMAKTQNIAISLLPAVERVNRRQLQLVANKLREELGELNGRHIAVLGLTFKPNSDDLRDSQSLALATLLGNLGCVVHAFDPIAMEEVAERMPWMKFGGDVYAAAEGTDAVVLATAWPEFNRLDFGHLRAVMNRPLIVDARNCLPVADLRREGFTYLSFGRTNLKPSFQTSPAPAVPLGRQSGAPVHSAGGG